MGNIKIQLGSATFNMTAYGQAKISDGFFLCAESTGEKITLLLRLFLYSASIELGLKSSVLSRENTARKLGHLKKLGHDLIKLYDFFQLHFPNESILESVDLAAVAKINNYFKTKGLEYVTANVRLELLSGAKGFPTVLELRTAAAKINAFLVRNDFHIDS